MLQSYNFYANEKWAWSLRLISNHYFENVKNDVISEMYDAIVDAVTTVIDAAVAASQKNTSALFNHHCVLSFRSPFRNPPSLPFICLFILHWELSMGKNNKSSGRPIEKKTKIKTTAIYIFLNVNSTFDRNENLKIYRHTQRYGGVQYILLPTIK